MKILENYIVERRVDAGFATHLRQFDASDQESIVRLISSMKPSANSLRGLLRLLEEIGHRDSRSITSLLEEPSISELLSAENVKGKTLQSKLTSILEGMRYPERAVMNEKLQGKLKELIREFGVAVSVPDELEGDSIVLSFKARSCEEISKKALSLVEMGKHPACKEVYSILLGEGE